jgi:photosystem II stability/assembly factor-like uncharacterized protein
MADLELTVVHDASDRAGYVGSFAITDRMIVTAGGTSSHTPSVLASSNARHFEPRRTPRDLGLRDVVAAGDTLWACGEYGQLARSADHGRTWTLLATGTDVCLFALALAPDGAVWVVGDRGYAARARGEQLERIELGTTVRFTDAYALHDEIVILGSDGSIRRWRGGAAVVAATGATRPLTGLAVTRRGTWILVGDAGFVARSPDGAWFARARTDTDADLEAVAALADGRLVAVGDRGHVLISADDGRTWGPLASGTAAHLWSIAPFGDGVLIGGDRGLIVKLAPPGDRTWHDRVNVFAGARPLDAVFSPGPDGFIGHRLAEYLAELPTAPVASEDEDLADDDDDDVSDVAFALLAAKGDAGSFDRNYGMPLPADLARLRQVVGRREDVFEELALDEHLLPDVGDENLFELLVRRDQHAHLGTGLVEAFAGVFCIGSQGNGDTFHMELYEWDGTRQVLHYDHERHAFTGVVADRLDSLAFLGALGRARDTGAISSDVIAASLRALHAKVAPTWHFSLHDLDPDFVRFDAKRRDSEFFFYRSRWICALLENRGEGIQRLFDADFNQVVPAEQLPARFESCETLIPTALYAMWRAFLFDEPELAEYLEIARRHRARLVRDAARLIDELRGGRNHLGTIRDVRTYMAAFRALDLDPRRAEQRQAEAAARARADAARRLEVKAELDRTPAAGWAELAWKWLDDGVAHRAVLERLDRVAAIAQQIAELDRLRVLDASDRSARLTALARALAPELEAVLVGALVRDDQLESVLPRPASGDDSASEDDDESPGWEAIDRALAPVYRGAQPHAHYGTVLPYMRGGNDPIHGISVYLRSDPVPHFHLVTYGFTDLFVKETEDPDESGFGFELTLRLARGADDTEVPGWALSFLQNLGRYVFSTGNRFGVGHKMGLNGPIAQGADTRITAVLFAADPELGEIASPFGKAAFLQVVGITDEEYRLIQEWSTTGLVEILRRKLPHLVTDLARGAVLDDPVLAAEVQQRVEAEGSSEDLTFAGELLLARDGERVRVEMGALYAAALPRAMRGRLRHGRAYTLRGRDAVLHFEPDERAHCDGDRDELTLFVTPQLVAEIEARLRGGLAGEYRFEMWPALQIVVTPSFIRDQGGLAIDVRGVADQDTAARMLEGANAPPPKKPHREDPQRARLRSALALSARALRLAPADQDVQFTHAMLLVDGDRLDELLVALPRFTPATRWNIAARLGKLGHSRFRDALELVLRDPALGDTTSELLAQIGVAILAHAPDRMTRFARLLPEEIELLGPLASNAVSAGHREVALELYELVLAMPIPEEGPPRRIYLGSLNDACVLAHVLELYDRAVQIADLAQPFAHENPYIYHAAACAYAAAGDHARAFEQVKLALAHGYDHVPRIEVDTDLGPILEWPEFKALFREWRARQEGN